MQRNNDKILACISIYYKHRFLVRNTLKHFHLVQFEHSAQKKKKKELLTKLFYFIFLWEI